MIAVFISCKQKKEEPKLKVSNFIFANYDTGLFYLYLYVSIQPNGVIKIRDHRWLDFKETPCKFYKDTLPDSLINIINRLLLNKKFEKNYPDDDSIKRIYYDKRKIYYDKKGIIYYGATYYLSFIGQDSVKEEITFNPYSVNNQLDSLGYYITNFIDNKTLHTTMPFNTDSITNYLKSYSLRRHPLPPPPIEMKQFAVPKVIYDAE